VTVPTLKRVSIVPTFTKDGRLLSKPGFDEQSGIFLDLKVDVDVPERPTRQQVRTALRQLWFPISQFPFVEKSDKVHALAMILEPYMRDMFGPTPFHFINKPEAGTGASLFIETALYPTLGAWPDAQTAPKSSDEMKKTLTACLAEGDRCRQSRQSTAGLHRPERRARRYPRLSHRPDRRGPADQLGHRSL
jgi:hypothetical protein